VVATDCLSFRGFGGSAARFGGRPFLWGLSGLIFRRAEGDLRDRGTVRLVNQYLLRSVLPAPRGGGGVPAVQSAMQLAM
jgi:hypothetical protein